MRHTWILAALLFTACHDATSDVKVFADRACACTDKVCADKVVDDFGTWGMENAKTAVGDEEKLKDVLKSLMTCAIKQGVDPTALSKKLTDMATAASK